jgi:glycosyltransferase involved in cell wall biosynthesis
MSLTDVCTPILDTATRPGANARSVLLFINGLGYGGAEVQVVQLATGLRKRGWDTTVVTMLPPRRFTDDLDRAGVDLECLNMRRGVADPRAILRFRRILRRKRPQIVHSHIAHANLLARLARLVCPMPVLITTAHSMIEGGRMLEIAYRLTDRLADLTTNVSQAAVDRYVRIGAAPSDRIQFVPNGVDLERFRPDESQRQSLRTELGVSDQFVWLAVGRPTAAKNYPNMIDAFARLSDLNALLLIVGRGEMEADLRQRADQPALRGRVRLLGARSDVAALMNSADGYVLSSDWEGMPLVLQEASCTRLPIVATDVGGNREVVVDGRTGLVVPAKDPAALAAAMRRVMAMTIEQRRELGSAARQRMAEVFDLERVLDRWEGLYHELASRRIPVLSGQ